MSIKKIVSWLRGVFSDAERPGEAKYDPVHVGAMIVLVIFGASALFWLLWALLVFGGGLQAKILPFIQIVFTSRIAADFGYEGYPYAMGVFEGWPTNLAALVILAAVILAGWHVFNRRTDENRIQRKP